MGSCEGSMLYTAPQSAFMYSTVLYVTIDNNTKIMFSAVYRWKEEKKKPEEVGKKLR